MPRSLFRFLVALLLPLALGTLLRGDVTLAPLFTDGAVLQRDKPLRIWGHADPGERVVLTFRDQTAHATAGRDGYWLVTLEPLHANAVGAELTVAGNNTVTLQNVVVGDVWLCSGQSNMEWPVKNSAGAEQEIPTANFPLLRHVKVARQVAATPRDTVGTTGWQPATPATVGEFSAVAYYFGRDLHRRLNVPIGLITSAWGGTPIESWMSPAALGSDPAFAVVTERWEETVAVYPERKPAYDRELALWQADEAAARATGQQSHAEFLKQRPRPRAPRGPGDAHTPTGLFNGMINPLLPAALRGVIWYQGESNAPRSHEYHALFRTLIASWRAHFGQEDLPFYWVQLANFKNDHDWALLREAQTQTLALPHTGQAVTIDIGDPDDIHPRNKHDVGRRLAAIARAQLFGFTHDYSGPVFVSAIREGATLRVRFDHAGGGLIARDRPVQSLEVAGADRKFFPATARIDRDMLVVSAPEVKEPVAVRYAWSNAPVANLYNGAGLPAVPFRSDDW